MRNSEHEEDAIESQMPFESKDASNDSGDHPLERASILSMMMLGWMWPLIRLATDRGIDNSDIASCPKFLRSVRLNRCFEKVWGNTEGISFSNSRPRLFWVLYKCFGRRAILGGFFGLVYAAAQLGLPFLIRGVLDYLSSNNNSTSEAIGFSLGMGALAFISSQSFVLMYYHMQIFGLEVRAAVMNAVFKRCLTMTTAEAGKGAIGQSTNLMSVDAEKLFLTAQYLHAIWLFPLLCTLVLGVLVSVVGWSAVTGIVLLILLLPLQLELTKRVSAGRKAAMQQGDKRVKYTNEVLQNIRAIKLFAWEGPAQSEIESRREAELHHVQSALYTRGWLREIMFLNPQLVAAIIFGTYVYVFKEEFNTLELFEVLALVNVLRTPSMMFAQCLSTIGEAKIAWQRIDSFLIAEPVTVPEYTIRSPQLSTLLPSIEISGKAQFSWHIDYDAQNESSSNHSKSRSEQHNYTSNKGTFSLHNIDTHVSFGELVAVVGVVGSGKSSFISAILGEMPVVNGRAITRGKLAYVAQTPWIQNLTVKDNILFGRKYIPEKYNAVLYASCLLHDISRLPSGDLTEIGERGHNLSGGQKARVAYARALYADDSDVLLLDDPFSAVDSTTGENMFSRGLGSQGTANNVTRVVVLNSHLHLLHHFDRIFVLQEGALIASGPFDDVKDYIRRFVNVSDDNPKSKAVHSRDKDASKIDTASKNGRSLAVNDAERIKKGSLVRAESRVKGRVSFSIYRQYFSSAMKNQSSILGVGLLVGCVCLFAAGQALRMMSDVWLVKWAEQKSRSDANEGYIYFGLLGAATFVQLGRVTVLMSIATSSARQMHRRILSCVLRAPIPTFFDVTSGAEIINRFSSDLERVDMLLPDGIMQVLQNILHSLGIIILASVTTPILIAVLVILIFGARHVFKLFSVVFQDLKRLESMSRTPIYSTYSEILTGLATIRAFKATDFFASSMRNLIDFNTERFLLFRMASLWLMWRLDFIAAIIIWSLGLLMVATASEVDASLAGLALVYAMQLTSLLQRVVFIMIETETHMTSAERIFHYAKIEQEPPQHIPESDAALGNKWPKSGCVEFRNVWMRYRSDDPVLRNISFEISGGQRVGICGSTGAGKSSILVALFRLNPIFKGSILLDGVNTSTIGLHKLRTSMSIIPQDPTLLSGTVKFNIDPFNQYDEDRIWSVLKLVGLEDTIRNLEFQLKTLVSEGGQNFSQGERQLMCIARALAQPTVRVLVMDEATASIDAETDRLVQKAIRGVSKNITIITIAHRLQTILDSDQIFVMNNGQIAEFGPPNKLLSMPESHFRAMATSAGLVAANTPDFTKHVKRKIVI